MAQPVPQPQSQANVLIGPDGETTTWEFITPEMALAILKDHNGLNRPMKPVLYNNYAKDMAAGRFMRTHQGIGYDVNGVLTDGQNRLQGIVNSGVGQLMMVTRGLEPDTHAVVDAGGPRPLVDRMVLVGFTWVSASTVATLRRMLAGFVLSLGTPLRASEAEAALHLHEEAMSFTEDCFHINVRGVTLSSVRAVVARAFYHADLARLRAFTHVLITGLQASEDDQSAVLLRNTLLMMPSTSRGAGQQVKVYRKAERALLGFLQREYLTRPYETNHELFPLPEEQKPRRSKRRKGDATDEGKERA